MASVLAQTVRPQQVVLVDDASPDEGRTLSTLRDLARSAEEKLNVHVVALDENRGPAGARNAGWALASEPLIAFLDSDDAWHPRKIELQASFMRENPDLSMSGHRYMVRRPGEPPEWPVRDPIPSAPISYRRLLVHNSLVTAAVMLRRDLPVRFDETQRRCEDFLLWLRLLSEGHRAAMLEAPLACLYKPEFGAMGLSGDLLALERAELSMYGNLRRERRLPFGSYWPLMALSAAKFLRRVLLTSLRPRTAEQGN